MSRTFAIIGGGIAGASIAYHLGRRTDARIIVFDRGEAAAETTARSVAQFGYYGDETQYEMKQYGMRLYNRFFAAPRRDTEYQFAGLLVVATTPNDAERLIATARRNGDPDVGKTAGTGWDRDLVEYLAPDDIHRKVFVPPLDVSSVTGAIYRPRMGYLHPPAELGREFVSRAQDHGVEFRFDTPVTDVRTDRGVVEELVADESIEVDEVVCAAGPWNPEVAAMVGIDLPVRHTLAPVLQVTPPSPIRYGFPAITQFDAPYAIHQRHPNASLIGYNPPGGYDRDERFDAAAISDDIPADIRDEMWEAARTLTPMIADGTVEDEWVGVRSQTPDGNPIVGWTEVAGFSIAAFHTSGIQLAPAVGHMIARQLLDGEPTSWYDALSITRFEGYRDLSRGDRGS